MNYWWDSGACTFLTVKKDYLFDEKKKISKHTSSFQCTIITTAVWDWLHKGGNDRYFGGKNFVSVFRSSKCLLFSGLYCVLRGLLRIIRKKKDCKKEIGDGRGLLTFSCLIFVILRWNVCLCLLSLAKCNFNWFWTAREVDNVNIYIKFILEFTINSCYGMHLNKEQIKF